MDNKKLTIQDIAKRAGVSPATVSRVLNNYAHVSEKKRAKVMAVIENLDYRPALRRAQCGRSVHLDRFLDRSSRDDAVCRGYYSRRAGCAVGDGSHSDGD
ncbi:MAG: LacI family DNA-binding transcriptional regulator [Chloroflexi bacterium]|uniref:LacI family DNA-binding transcriptional regulator n=1 Tax=Candidatus Flexifilum breve TaxID=3140694 RepID=UPI003136EB41|nr:LacI family DNA-binding transcriptional regulator [Chloroflexota bacterium]